MLLRGQKDLMNLSVRPAGLAFLVGRSWGTIQFWTKYKGLPRNGDGTYNLKVALRWIEHHYKDSTAIKISLVSLSQQRLAELLGVSRQTLHDWTEKGLPRNSDGSYDFLVVLRWIPKFYEKLYRNKYHKSYDKGS